MLNKDTVINWLGQYVHFCIISLSILFVYKPGSFESFGLFLLASGLILWYNKEVQNKNDPLTTEDVQEITQEICFQMISLYMEEFLSSGEFEGDIEGFNPDTFPPWTNDDNPFNPSDN